jgi:hypothetical protein
LRHFLSGICLLLPRFSQICCYQIATSTDFLFFLLFLSLPTRLFFLRSLIFFLCYKRAHHHHVCLKIVLRRTTRLNASKQAMEVFFCNAPELNISEWSSACRADFRSVLFHNCLPYYALYASISKKALKHRERVIIKKNIYLENAHKTKLILAVNITVHTNSLIEKYTATCVHGGNMCLFDCCISTNERTYVSFHFLFIYKLIIDTEKNKWQFSFFNTH